MSFLEPDKTPRPKRKTAKKEKIELEEKQPEISEKTMPAGYQVTGVPSPGFGICRVTGLGNSAHDAIDRPADLIVLKSNQVFFGIQVKRPGPVVFGLCIDQQIYPFRMHVETLEISFDQTDKIEPLAFEYPKEFHIPGTVHVVEFFTGEMTGNGPKWTGQSQVFVIEIP